MTNPELRTELRSMLEGIMEGTSRGLQLADIPPPPTEVERDQILQEFSIVQARMWADVCRCILMAGEVEITTGLTDENYDLVTQVRDIHDSMVCGKWGGHA